MCFADHLLTRLLQKLGQEIGSGAFGVVFMAMNRNTGETVAIKRFPLKSIEKDSLSSIEVRYFA